LTDPERLDEEIDYIDPDIEFDYGKKYDELSDSEKEEVINQHFFIGNPNVQRSHPEASREIRIALDSFRSGGISRDEITVSRFSRRGRNYTVIRDKKTGRIMKWA